MQQPRKRNLHWCCIEGCCNRVELRRLQWSEPAQREERHISDALLREIINKAIVTSLGYVVQVLHADDVRNFLRLGQLFGTHIAQPEMANQSLTLELGEHCQRFFNGSVRWSHHSAHAQVDGIELVEPKVAQVVMSCIDQFLTG